MSFLNEFFNGNSRSDSPRGVDSKYTIKHDKWDAEDYRRIHDEVKDFSVAEKDLRNIAGEAASAAMADEFFSLVKAIPQLKDPKDVRPSHLINASIMAEQMKLSQYESLRAHSVGDPIGTALAAVAMEPALEGLYDKLKKERELAEQLEQQMSEYEGLEEEQRSIEEMMQDVPQDSQEAADYQQQAEQIAEQMERLRADIQDGQQELSDQLDGQSGTIRAAMGKAVNEALNDAENQSALGAAWGMDRGTIQRMDAAKRVELAKKLRNDKFKRLAELVGPMMRMAWAEQARKVNTVPEEVFDVELGNDINHMLPTEYLYLHMPELRIDWMRRFVDNSLLQYKLRGNDKVAKGGIIFCEDGSGSMAGEREVWAKAVGLALLQVAKMQKRPFTAYHFGSSNEIMNYDFDTVGKQLTADRTEGMKERFPQHLVGPEAVIDFAELFFGGGTDFVTPLSKALDKLRQQHAENGAVKGDIVFVTDGQCGVPPAWLDEFKAEQVRLGFRVFGVMIGGSTSSEPLNTICDGRIVTVSDLLSGKQISDIFGSL